MERLLIEDTDFSKALEYAKLGYRIATNDMLQNGEFVVVTNTGTKPIKGEDIWNSHLRNYTLDKIYNKQIEVAPYLAIKNRDDIIQMGWLPSMGEILSDDDWNVLANH